MICNRCHQRSATECGSMVPGLDGIRDFFRDENCAHRQSTRERLCNCHHVRCHARALVCHEGSESAKATLNLVEDESNSPLFSHATKISQQLRLDNANPTFALHGLDDHGSNGFPVERNIELCLIA